MTKPVIAITMGDASGVGPEIIVQAMCEKEVYRICSPLVIGDAEILEKTLKIVHRRASINPIGEVKKASFKFAGIDVLVPEKVQITDLQIGKINTSAAKAAVAYLKEATSLIMRKELDAIVTAPINKEAIRKAGFYFEGHTEFFAQMTNTRRYAMMFVGGGIKVVLVTTHFPIKRISSFIIREKVLKIIKLTDEVMKKYFKVKRPKIGVAGLNPHAGEAGIFGEEEEKEIIPAIEEARKKGIQVCGPISPDVIFYKAKKKEIDVVVSMYHDQGIIPVKMMDFEKAVNITIGLPFVRTSVDHGVAYDIAGKGIASHQSLLEAIKLAAKLSRAR